MCHCDLTDAQRTMLGRALEAADDGDDVEPSELGPSGAMAADEAEDIGDVLERGLLQRSSAALSTARSRADASSVDRFRRRHSCFRRVVCRAAATAIGAR
jgi:hypothetical protein